MGLRTGEWLGTVVHCFLRPLSPDIFALHHHSISKTLLLWRLTRTLTVSSDSGEYHCIATPWYLSASTGAWTEAGELTSGKVFLTVKFAGEFT